MNFYKILKSRFIKLIIVSIMLMILMGVSSGGSKINGVGNIFTFISTPFQKASMSASDKTKDFFYYFKDMDKLRDENKKIKGEISKLKEENRKLNVYKTQNDELRKALKLKDDYDDYEPVGANIIAMDLGNWFDVFRIDAGSKDGIKNDFPVRASEGLVGRIQSSDVADPVVGALFDK